MTKKIIRPVANYSPSQANLREMLIDTDCEEVTGLVRVSTVEIDGKWFTFQETCEKVRVK